MRGRPRGTVINKHASTYPWKTEKGNERSEESIRQSLKQIRMEGTFKMPEEYVADILEGKTSMEELKLELDRPMLLAVQARYLALTKEKRAESYKSEEIEQDEIETEKFKNNTTPMITPPSKKRGRPKGWKPASGSKPGKVFHGMPFIDQKILQLENDLKTLKKARDILSKTY